MAFFDTFFIQGFSKEGLKFYSPGTLYEVLSKLGEDVKPEEMRRKVKSLLDSWSTSTNTFRKQGMKVPAYALEIHAINEKSNPYNGYGTYVFVPDERQSMVVVPLTSIFSKPNELYDDEDPMKILADNYADEDGYSTNSALTIYELSTESEDFYPLNIWSKELSNDPLEEIFGIFDALKANEYAGISLVVIPPEDNWDLRGRKRIRAIEDPQYREEIGFFETMRRVFNSEPLPDEEADRLAGYTKQQLDEAEKNERDAIYKKISANTFRCTLRIYASSKHIADDLAGIIMQKMDGRYNSLDIVTKYANLRDLAMRREGLRPFLMSDDEIATLWHVPCESTGGEKRHHPLPAALTPPDDLIMIPLGGPGDIRKLILSVKP